MSSAEAFYVVAMSKTKRAHSNVALLAELLMIIMSCPFFPLDVLCLCSVFP